MVANSSQGLSLEQEQSKPNNLQKELNAGFQTDSLLNTRLTYSNLKDINRGIAFYPSWWLVPGCTDGVPLFDLSSSYFLEGLS
jgi:hypothetical protein